MRSPRLAVGAVVALASASAGLLAAVAPGQAGAASAPWKTLACSATPVGHARCLAEVWHPVHATTTQTVLGRTVRQTTSPVPSAYTPHMITTAYGFATTGGAGRTIAIVDAYGDATIAANLATFSTEYGLPSCTTTNGCFKKVNQTGGSTYPAATRSGGWELETSLDVEWAHAMAPDAHILLVEATSASTTLFTAVKYAASNAQYVSMSWGGTDSPSDTSYDGDFSASGVSYFAATGDTGASVIYPAASPKVIAVGGTTLTLNTTDTWASESAWSTAGGGCSAYETANAAQAAYPTYDQHTANCNGKRATPDISLDANPSTGVSVYDTVPYTTGFFSTSGWFQVGGTSASTAMVAAHATETGQVVNASYVYGSSIKVYDVTTGSVTTPFFRTPSHPCEAGYDLCTGRGSWNTAVGTSTSPPSGSLEFTATGKSLTAGNHVELSLHTSAEPSGAFTATLSTTSAAGDFSSSATGTYTHTLRVPVSATGTATVYYEDTKAGAPTITAAASGWGSATRSVTVTAGALARITVSPSSASVAEGKTQVFTATGYDADSNPVSGFSPTWTTTAPGSVNPAAGTSTTFTAGASTGSGTVTAKSGTIEATASVTVTSAHALTVALTKGSVTKRSGTYRVPLSAKVTSAGKVVSSATVVFDVYSGTTCAGTPVGTASVKTSSTGVARYTFSSSQLATFCAEATASKSGYTTGSTTTTFST